jgi:hypothetical protein
VLALLAIGLGLYAFFRRLEDRAAAANRAPEMPGSTQ